MNETGKALCVVCFLFLLHGPRSVAFAEDRTGATSEQVIPFRLTEWNNISVPTTLNDRIALNLMFHTAVDTVSLTKATTERFPEISFQQQANVQSWGGRSVARVSTENHLAIGALRSRKVTIFEDLHSGHETDGKFGPTQLDASVFSLDFDRTEIRLMPPVPRDLPEWESLDLEVESGILYLSGTIDGETGQAKNRFLLHSGYSGFMLLDDEFVNQHAFIKELPVEKQDELKDSGGNKIVTKQVRIPSFKVGGVEFESVPASFFSGAIGRQRFSVLGGDFLKRFNLVFDVENKKLYVQKNTRFESAHFDDE